MGAMERAGTFNIKITLKAVSTVCSVGSELDLRNAFQRRSLAIDQAKLCSFREIEMWIQHLFLSHERAQPSGFASVTLQQIIECDKQMFIRASNSVVGKLQAEPEVTQTPLDNEIRARRTSPELMPYLMPMSDASATTTPTRGLRRHQPISPRNVPKATGKARAKASPRANRGPTSASHQDVLQ